MIFTAEVSPSFGQTTASGDHVRIRWLAPDSFERHRAEKIGLYFEVEPGWHVYWRNAGDSGAAPKFDFTSITANVGEPEWPFPTRLPIAHLTNLGYENNVAYLFDVTPITEDDKLKIVVTLEWLVCKVDCIPGFGSMVLSRPVNARTEWQENNRKLRDHFAARIPQPDSGGILATVTEIDSEKINLFLENIAHLASRSPEVYPLNGDLLTATQPERSTDETRITYTFSRVPGSTLPRTTDFVLVDSGQAWRLARVPILPAASAASAPTAQPKNNVTLWVILLSAFAGGVILNLMPCVFPVLSIKLIGLLGADTANRLREGALYSAGVLTTFALLGAALLIVRAGGASVGWGFQLQSPVIVLSLIILFWLMALSFSGYFEFGHRLMNLVGSSHGGSFVTGVLAVFVAAPCTGPFMGTALGAATVVPAPAAMAIFLSLGAGLTAPFLLLCAMPSLMNRLPAPGPWMEKLRQFLAFPLYATVIWLMWVLGRLWGDDGWLIGSLLLLTVVFAIWLFRNAGTFGQFAAPLVLLAIALYGFNLAAQNKTVDSQALKSQPISWQPFESARIEQAIKDQRPVFVDYTAAWCITCQVNKKLVLESDYVLALFADNNVLLVRADWTHHNPAITESLAKLGRNSVPVYAWYGPGKETPVLLPQILQEGMITELFHQKTQTPNNREELL